MVKAINYVKQSISRRFVVLMLSVLTLIIAGALAALWLNYTTLEQHRKIENELKRKQELVSEISYHTNQVFFRVRGYYAFRNKQEYAEIFQEKKELEQSLAAFSKLKPSPEEIELTKSIRHFFDEYFAVTLPKAVGMVERDDYDSLRKLSSSGLNQTVNELVAYANEFKKNSELELKKESEELSNVISGQGFLFLIYFLGILLAAVWVTFRVARDVGTPLTQLSSATDKIARGEHVMMPEMDRSDEIGHLSRSFHSMMVQIQTKEEELLMQNEELQAQQDELQMQQEELQEALAKTEASERYLEKRNRLIMSLANTLNKQELLTSIIHNMVEVTAADKGIIVLLNQSRDHAGFGIAPEGIRQFLDQLESGMLIRIRETLLPYQLKRKQTAGERGYHVEEAYGHDLFLPVLSAKNELIACMVLTRLGKSATEPEMKEITGLAKQISLSLEKLDMYEETEKQRQLTQDILDTIQEGVQLLNPSGVTIQVNRKMFEILGQSQPGGQVHTPHELLFPYLQKYVSEPEKMLAFITDAVIGKARSAKTFVYEVNLEQKRYIQMYDVPLYRGADKLGTLLVHRDITREYEIDQMKSEFVSTVSHELRTPLASVLGFAELLLHKQLSPERQRKYMQTIHQEATRLTNLINDFLDLQRMESGKQNYNMTPLNLIEIVKEAIELQRVNTRLHRFVFEPKQPLIPITGDADKIRQVITNLLSNAVKYSPAGGPVEITCEEENGFVKLDVSDQGLGIPEESLPHLFTKFYRVDNSDRREIGGTGLGLAIVKEILGFHQGTIDVSTEFGRGSTFTVQLPLTPDEQRLGQEEAAVAVHPQKISTGGQIVLVEDDVNLAELLRTELESSDFTVFHFANGREAVQQIAKLQPDAVVLDLMLGAGMDGWQVISEMKENQEASRIPILISSAFEEKNKAWELGAKGYLVKPYHPKMLTEVLNVTIAKRERAGQIYVPDPDTKSDALSEEKEDDQEK
ncbi:UNVERIFIED_CONTAM: signal transduction histidine kinase/FixJ family two-component response regulator [Brevibacillus sp. OAP136]